MQAVLVKEVLSRQLLNRMFAQGSTDEPSRHTECSSNIRRGRSLGETVAQPLGVGQRTCTPANRAPHEPVIADCAMDRHRAHTCLGCYPSKRYVLSDVTASKPAKVETARLLRVRVPVLPTVQHAWAKRDAVLTNRPMNDRFTDTGLRCDLTQRHLIDFVTLTQPIRINLLGLGSSYITTNVVVA